jgi:hypothetical protein
MDEPAATRHIAEKEQHSEPTITKIVVDDTPALRRC